MIIRRGVLGQLRTVVAVRVFHCERAHTSGNVGCNVANTCNLFQIASNRGGATASDHVWNFEGDKRELGRRRFVHVGRIRSIRVYRYRDFWGRAASQGYRKPRSKQHGSKSLHVYFSWENDRLKFRTLIVLYDPDR